MCTVRCPIEVHVEGGEVVHIEGSHPGGLNGSLCPRGGAGVALLNDSERPQQPLIRIGERGEGRWRQASWNEALSHVADKLMDVINRHGNRSVLFSDRGGPFPDLHKAFVKGLGSPNYCNHDASCARNVQHSAKSVMGLGRKGVSYDLKNAKHVVTQTRNIFEAINVSEVKNLTQALNSGCKLTVIDVRTTLTAAKAHNFFMVKPGSDYAFNLAVINTLIQKDLYDIDFVKKHFKDFDALVSFVQPYTAEWAGGECGIEPAKLVAFCKQLAEAAPQVIWHPGWNTARFKDSFYVSRTAYIINGLLGSLGAKGGLAITNKAKDCGKKGLKALADLFPKPEEKRADGVGWRYKHFDGGPGLLHLAFKAIETEDPYPVKAYIAYRHDPLMAMPDPDALRKVFDKLDLLISITFSWSDTAWYSDVVLPLSTYLERESIIAHKGGVKPKFFLRQRAVPPRYRSMAEWEIFTKLAKLMNMGPLAKFDSIEDIWKYQLEDTGLTISDFKEKGQVGLTDKPIYRDMDKFKWGSPSGKLEVISEVLEKAKLPSLKPYEPPQPPPDGQFRITFGRCALHTQGHTVNNPLLNEAMPINPIWINSLPAAHLGIKDGDQVEVSGNGYKAVSKAYVTDMVHPDCIFMLHGFGHKLPVESRAYGKGVADHELMKGGLDIWDPAGGAIALQEHFVSVKKAQ
ncbi:thiosulfate reductase [Dethiosulfatarculus sandiegensis]|uniref:Thiosulfate reductase n=2 Tax=Dethiosulfatarculus sandiegensis TaxID=1429043 RepID=A0A0D2JYW3_9BACT|nr:thiosulfate reductase [Dethiosulfatarculus sandiegensis]